jgi:hypothetical protein
MGIGLANGSVDYLILKIQKNKAILKKLMYLQLLVLDEVSMLGDDLFEKINIIFQTLRASDNALNKVPVTNPFSPFSGIVLIFVHSFDTLYDKTKSTWMFSPLTLNIKYPVPKSFDIHILLLKKHHA